MAKHWLFTGTDEYSLISRMASITFCLQLVFKVLLQMYDLDDVYIVDNIYNSLKGTPLN